jgi:hypothetical protein
MKLARLLVIPNYNVEVNHQELEPKEVKMRGWQLFCA